MSEQFRKAQLTINNPKELGLDHDVIRSNLAEMNIDYACFSDEIASTGTYHTHVFLYREAPIRFNTLKNRFAGAHIEQAYGSIAENRDYVAKKGKWSCSDKAETSVVDSFEEYGTLPAENEKTSKQNQLIELILEGMTTADIILNNPKYAFRTKDIDILRQTLLENKYRKENRKVEVTYIFGETGTGKTRSVYAKFSADEICRITSYSSSGVRFDSYHGQNVLVFEEYRSQIPIAEMLSYLDIYPLILPARYNDRVACYTHVFIISNYSLDEQYTEIQRKSPETWKAFLRRITHIYRQVDFGVQEEIEKEEVYAKSEQCPFT